MHGYLAVGPCEMNVPFCWSEDGALGAVMGKTHRWKETGLRLRALGSPHAAAPWPHWTPTHGPSGAEERTPTPHSHQGHCSHGMVALWPLWDVGVRTLVPCGVVLVGDEGVAGQPFSDLQGKGASGFPPAQPSLAGCYSGSLQMCSHLATLDRNSQCPWTAVVSCAGAAWAWHPRADTWRGASSRTG